MLTERDIPRIVARNIEWLYPVQAEELSWERLASQLEFYASFIHDNPHTTLIDISKSIDIAYSQSPGAALKELRQLLASRFISFDIKKDFKELIGADLTLSSPSEFLEAIHASG